MLVDRIYPDVELVKRKAQQQAQQQAQQTQQTQTSQDYSNVNEGIKTMNFVQSGTQLNPGVERYTPKPSTNIFLESWFENSPWGLFTPESPPKVAEHPSKKKEILAGKILGEAGDVAAAWITGFGVGKAISTSTRATRAVATLGGKSRTAQAIRGTLKGSFIGGEAGKAYMMHVEGYTPEEIAIAIGGDVGSFLGFEKGFKTAVEPKVNELAIQEKTHQQSQHIIYGEKGESIGVGMKGTGEKGWKPTVYPTKTKGVSASEIDKPVGMVREEIAVTKSGAELEPWYLRMKRFLLSGERSLFGYNPSKPFESVTYQENVLGGGIAPKPPQTIQIQKPPISSSLSGSARLRVISAIKEAGWITLPRIGLGGVSTIGGIMERKEKIAPEPILIREEKRDQIVNISPKPSQVLEEAQKERQRFGYTQIPQGSFVPVQKQREEPMVKEDVIPKQTPSQITKTGFVPPTPTFKPPEVETIPATKTAPATIPKSGMPLISKVTPPAFKPSKIMSPALPFRPRAVSISKSPVSGKISKRWEKVNIWGDISLGLGSLEKSFEKLEKQFGKKKSKKQKKGKAKGRKKKTRKKKTTKKRKKRRKR